VTKRAAPYLFIIFLLLAVHAALVLAGVSPLSQGEMIGADAYTRLLRVELLATDIGSWFDNTIPGMNAPYGDELNWSRPLDVLIMAGALPLVAYGGLEWREAIFLAGAWLPPLLHILMALTLTWAAAPLIPVVARPVLVLLVGMVPILLAYNMAGRLDEQTLLLIALFGMLGWVTRGLQESFTHPVRAGLLAGLSAGFGLWVTVEAQFAFVILTAVLGLLWLERGNERVLQVLEGLALGFFVMVCAGVLAERGGEWHSIRELDKISLSHALGAAVNVGLWGFLVATARHAPPIGRIILSLLWGVLAFGGVLFFAPELFRGPLGNVDPRVLQEFLLYSPELRPLWPVDRVTTGQLLLWLGVPLLALPLWLLLRPAKLLPWVPLLVLTVAFTTLALLHAGFAFMAVPMGCALLTHVIAQLMDKRWRVLAVSLVLTPLLAGFGFTALAAVPSSSPQCHVPALRAALAALPPGIIMALPHTGPELLYFTDHEVIATPTHRNRDGLLDAFDFFGAAPASRAQEILRQRGASYVLSCPGQGRAADSRLQQLADGKEPDWLEPLPLPSGQDFRLYRLK
jgi:hypothetical protein